MVFKSIFKGGLDLKHHKNTSNCQTVSMGVPRKVIIPMAQHIGAHCNCTVKKGDSVKVGQIIGDSDKFISAPIHSSVSGVVTEISHFVSSSGIRVETVEIKTDGKQEVHEDVKPPKYNNIDEFLEVIRQSGLVGLGGAGFPVHAKLKVPEDKAVDTLIINAAECEPYITSDFREMIEDSQNVIEGINIVADMLKVQNIIIGIEDNKPEAINALVAIAGDKIKIKSLKSRYPQGAEKMLIYALTGRKVPHAKLPSDVGVVVMNVTSMSFISKYIKTGMPLIKKRVTVDGSSVQNTANVDVFIGTLLEDVFNFCGGFKSKPHKVLMGGPMMGISQFSLAEPVVKSTNALLALNEDDSVLPEPGSCIRCGRCVEACPMNLLPLYINLNVLKDNVEKLKEYHNIDCIECGSCSYVCPAKIHLVQSIRLGKIKVRHN